MRKIKFILLSLVLIGFGYFLGVFLPFDITNTSEKAEAVLEVLVVTEGGQPLSGVEVDVAEEIGPPLPGGVVLTDEEGIASFKLKSGKYYIFFNTNNFPAGYEYPGSRVVNISVGEVNSQTIILSAE